MNWNNVKYLFLNEFHQEFKNKNTFAAIFLYVLASTFVAYISFKSIDSPLIWNALFWIILLFAAINTVSNSFKESPSQNAYLYTLVNPQEFILAKIISNSIVLIFSSILCLLSYSLFIGSYIQDYLVFISIIVLGSFCLAVILSLSAALAYKAAGNSSLYSVLSIPIVIPVLILLVSSSANFLTNVQFKSFIESEIYANETVNIKAELIKTQDNEFLFMDDEQKSRRIKTGEYKLIEHNKYIITGKYDSKQNTFIATQISEFKNNYNTESWIKMGSILLISLLIGGIGIIVFPQFWIE